MKRHFVGKCLAFAVIASWGAASLSGVEIVPDTRKIEPLAISTDEPAIAAAQAKIMGVPAAYAASFPVFIHLSEADADLPRKVANLGGRAEAVLPRLYTGAIPRDAARYLSNWPAVAYIEAGKRLKPLLDASRPATFADIVQSGGSGLPASYNGTGSFVGIIDTGLSQNHRDFYINGVLTQPRVAQWFPSQAAAGVDTQWHGTHVAGIAAGNGFSSGGLYTGMAPGARLLIYQSSQVTTSIPAEFNAVLAAAGASPVAVNLSLGLMFGPHDGTSGFEQSVNSSATGTAGSKRIVAVAAGNERGAHEHFQTLMPLFGAVTVPLAVAAGGAIVDIWADGADRYTVTTSVSGGTASVSSDQPPNGATHFVVAFSATAKGPASIQLQRTRNGGSGRIDAYVDDAEATFDAAVSVDAGTTIEPANGSNVLAAGSFTTKLGAFSVGNVGDISSFSSLGPTRDGRQKPDAAAPGAFIYSAKSLDPFAGSPRPDTVPTNDNYAIMAGTSMAAPHVTGIAALVWESNSSLTGAQMRARLRKTADLPAGVSAPGNTWGNGKVNALRAVSQSVASITAPATALPGAPVALSSENSSGAYNPATFAYNFSYTWSLVARPTGSGATLASTSPSTTFAPDVPGNYTVGLSVSQSAPVGVAAGSDTAVIRVNTIPVAAITTPPGSNNIVPATFAASATDPDVAAFGQSIAFHWVLVSRPTGSSATLSPIPGTANATLNPDIRGTYEVGVRADDGLDNSALTVASFWAGPPPASVGHGGGCSVAPPGARDPGTAAGTALFLLASLAGSIALRFRVRRTARRA